MGERYDDAQKLAAAIGGKGPVANGLVKRLLVEASDADLRTANALEAQAFGVVFSTQDKAEGVAAFVGKREPSFPGR